MDRHTVTTSNKSIDSGLVETDGKRGRYREITVDSRAGESHVNPDDWPSGDLKPSRGSVKGRRHVGPGGVKIDNLGELIDCESQYRTTRWRRHFEPNDIPRGLGPQDPACCVRSA